MEINWPERLFLESSHRSRDICLLLLFERINTSKKLADIKRSKNGVFVQLFSNFIVKWRWGNKGQFRRLELSIYVHSLWGHDSYIEMESACELGRKTTRLTRFTPRFLQQALWFESCAAHARRSRPYFCGQGSVPRNIPVKWKTTLVSRFFG